MKQSDTNAIANLYVESINKGAEAPKEVSDKTYNKICTLVGKIKRQGVPLEDATMQIQNALDYEENTDDLVGIIKRIWSMTDTIGDRDNSGNNMPGWMRPREQRGERPSIPLNPDLAPSELRFRARASGKRGEYK